MVGMVIVRPRRQHEVGFPQTDLADDLLARFQRRKQLAVVVVEDDVVDPDPASSLLGFRPAPRRERAAAFRLMSRIAVGDGDEADVVSHRGQLRRGAACALIAIVRVGTEGNHIQLAVSAWRLGTWLCGLLGAGQSLQRKPQHRGADDDSSH